MDSKQAPGFGAAEIGALAHLYRGEMYQSKIWRNRLDTTSNWAIVVTGIALSVTFSNADASPIPLLLVSWVVAIFLFFEARRYLYYDVFRVRVRVMEINLYGPILMGQGLRTDNKWKRTSRRGLQRSAFPDLVHGSPRPSHPKNLRLDLRGASGMLPRQDLDPKSGGWLVDFAVGPGRSSRFAGGIRRAKRQVAARAGGP